MKSIIATLLVLASSQALALPTQTLFFKKVVFDQDPPFYSAYKMNPNTDDKAFGSQAVPMTEEVAGELLALPVNTAVQCEARGFSSGRELLVYALNCH